VTGTTHWHFLSPEYPPDPGGVSDYTRLLCSAFASRGEVVHVWAPSGTRDESRDGEVHVHRLQSLNASGLRDLGRSLDGLPGPRRIFLQYVPTALGVRGMNVQLIRWLRARSEEVWVQFHEVALGWQLWRKPQHHLIHAAQLWMAAALADRADRIFVSVEGWLPRLGRHASRATWLPIPSNLPATVNPAERASALAELGAGPWIAHFGTYGPMIARDLLPALVEIARQDEAVRFLLLGRGAEKVARALLPGRVLAPGELGLREIAARLSIATLALQPFPDGISTRRTSAMAALALGVPVVSTSGHLTDSIWSRDTVALAPVGDAKELARLCLQLLRNPVERKQLGASGARLYQERFSVERSLETLLPDRGARLGDLS